MIKGPKSLVRSPTGVFYDETHDELWVSNFGNHSATVYKATASGDAAPLRVIRSAPPDAPTPNIGNAYAPSYDSKRHEILVPTDFSRESSLNPEGAIVSKYQDLIKIKQRNRARGVSTGG